MKKLLISLFLGALLTLPLTAQTSDNGNTDKQAKAGHPPKILQIFREEVKPGQNAAHAKSEANFPAAMSKVKFPYYSLAIESMSGPSEAWFINPVESWADWAKADKLMKTSGLETQFGQMMLSDGQLLNGTKSMIAVYNPDLSYRPDFNIGDVRYVQVTTYRVKPGHFDEFKELYKQAVAAHTKANIDEHMLFYAVRYGAPADVALVFQPITNIEQLDDNEKIHGKDFREALGADFMKKVTEFSDHGIATVESNLYSINPKMSYMSDDVVASAPDFWRPKEMGTMPAKTATPKPQPKMKTTSDKKQ